MHRLVREHVSEENAYYSPLLITSTNSLDPDQARRDVGPDLNPNCLTLMVFLKEFFENDFENNQQTTICLF